MKNTLFILAFLFSTVLFSQKILTAKDAVVQFEASVPFFEPVAAKNTAVHVALNTKKGYISFEITMNEFHFERSLMEEHFNENYVETERFPKATFSGIIEKFDLKVISKTPKVFLIKGKIKIHGISKAITTSATIKNSRNGMILLSEFDLNTDDFEIKIPFLVRNKISKNVTVYVTSEFHMDGVNPGNITNN